MKQRFTVERKNEVYYVRDNEHYKYNLPEMACTLFFGNPDEPHKIADVLNTVWDSFRMNPD